MSPYQKKSLAKDQRDQGLSQGVSSKIQKDNKDNHDL